MTPPTAPTSRRPVLPGARSGPSAPFRLVPGLVAAVYAALFVAGLYFVTGLHTAPGLPAPGDSQATIVRYFLVNTQAVRTSVYLSLLAELALGVLTAIIAGRLLAQGVAAELTQIVLFAGFATALVQTSSHICEWVLTWPGLGRGAMLGLYYLLYGLGGPGFSVLMGFLCGAVAIVGSRRGLLPRWIVGVGLVIAVIGAISSITFLMPTTFPFTVAIPLTRFPALAWLVAVGLSLPASRVVARSGGSEAA
ncbi:MAG TPA: hypothetical protein VIA06_17280 [Candidatus Dormibacteraeota bacterium]|nr:hypothetical protein [Candidatus Dormibacteraeota bacterium]